MFGVLKGLVMESEPGDEGHAPAAPTKATQPMATSGFIAPPLSTGPVLDPNLMQHLQSVVTKRRSTFTSLLEASEKLRSIIPDDLTRLKAAAVSVGGDKAAILRDVDIHMNDLDAEAQGFQRFADSEAAAKIGTLKATADRCEQTATQADQRVVQLQQEIQQLQQQAADQRNQGRQAVSDAQIEQQELDRKSQAFAAALAATKGSLQSQKQVLTTSL